MRVLVVDDNAALRKLFAYELEEAGIATAEAPSGEEGLRSALREPPDAVLVDYFGPRLDGAGLIRALRASRNDRLRCMPVVGLAGASGSERALLDAGANCCVQKPAAGRDVVKAVCWALSVYGERTP